MLERRQLLGALALLVLAGSASAAELARTRPYHSPLPEPDMEAQVYVEANPRQLHRCDLTALVDRFGELRDVVPTACPAPLQSSSVQAVRGWSFHPPVDQDRAVSGQYQVRFAYISHTVKTQVPREQGVRLVRMEPTARPDWPSPPRTTREMKQWMEENWRQEVVCVVDLRVSKRGVPEQVSAVDCPPLFLRAAVDRLERYGLTPQGAQAGDGTSYRMFLRFSPE